MIDAPPLTARRGFLSIIAGASFVGSVGCGHAMRTASSAPAAEDGPPDAAAILVAGPAGGTLDRWGSLLAPALAKGLPPETVLRRTLVGATDGVTGANQFGARTEPDGQTLLLAPGDAALAWLVGDPRARYDIARWMPVLAAVSSGIVFVRPGAAIAGRSVRLASAGPIGVDLPAVLGLEILGGRVDLVPALSDEGRLSAASQGGVDAVFLHGHKVEDQARALSAAGVRPLFALGTPDRIGRLARSPLFPGVPTLAEQYAATQGQPPGGALFQGWCASAAAAQLEFALVLPQMTPAAMMAVWRRAGTAAAAALDLQSIALANGLRTMSGAEAAAAGAALATDQAMLLALRGWLADRFNWRPA